ncbi:hypothetical protein, partial [Escherichia coli]|uniref:hypothetical protein n=1 Tax=Escherichia coli TaxID=562 RepID=UPI00227EA456
KRRVTLHLSKIKPFFEFAKSTQANSDLVGAKVLAVQKIVDYDVAQIRQLGRRLLEAQNPRVFLELESGQAVRGRYIS